MKKIFKFFGALLTVALTVALTGCTVKEDLGAADVGLHIKVFFPTKVVAGQPMTINGSGFSDVTEIVFPGDVVVTNFKIVSNDMIRVSAPDGIAEEGGTIILRTTEGDAESPLHLTLGHTAISTPRQDAYKMNPDTLLPPLEVIDGGKMLTVYGTDLEFINSIEFKDSDGNPFIIQDELFNVKSTNSIIVTVPKKVYEGAFAAKLYSFNETTFEMDSLYYQPAADGGYWETQKVMIWENDGAYGQIAWSSDYRFALEGTNGNGDAIVAEIPADTWDILKNGTFYMTVSGETFQIRVNTGWWSFDGDGVYDIHNGDERLVDNGDGTFTLAVTISEEPLKSGIYDLIDVQHLLFTGSGYTIHNIYYTEDVWVEGGGSMEIVKTSIWKNDGSVGAESWSGSPYRFGMEGMDGNNECVATIAPELWEKMKTTPFYVQVKPADGVESWQIRVLDGWWSVGNDASGALDFTPSSEAMVDNGDGTFTFVLDVNTHPSPDTPLVDIIDAQHLLFAGDGFIVLELYWEEEVFVPGGGDEPKEVVIWENDGTLGEGTWGNTYRFALEGKNGGDASVDVPADLWELFKNGPFHLVVKPVADWWQIRVLTGWWSAQWPTADDSGNGDVNVNWTDIVSDNGDGTFTVTLDFTGHAILDAMDEQNLLFAGAGFQILKVYVVQ